MPKKPEGMDQDTYEGGENEASSYPDMPDDKPKARATTDPRKRAEQLMDEGRLAEAMQILDKIKEDEYKEFTRQPPNKMARGGKIAGYAKGGRVGGRGDGCCTKGKTKGRVV